MKHVPVTVEHAREIVARLNALLNRPGILDRAAHVAKFATALATTPEHIEAMARGETVDQLEEVAARINLLEDMVERSRLLMTRCDSAMKAADIERGSELAKRFEAFAIAVKNPWTLEDQPARDFEETYAALAQAVREIEASVSAPVTASDADAMDRWLRAVGVRQRQAPWMEALDMQFAAARELHAIAKHEQTISGVQSPATKNALDVDIEAIRQARAFSWAGEPIAACRLAANSLPHTVTLSRDLLMADCGWWYFTVPIPVTYGSETAAICALLWSRAYIDGQPRIAFSAFVMGRLFDSENPDLALPAHLRLASGQQAAPTPFCLWLWREGETFIEMVDRLKVEMDDVMTAHETVDHYDGPSATQRRTLGVAHLKQAHDLSLFFAAGCLWLQQRVFTESIGHVERHAGKRIAREHDLPDRPRAVQIIELRRRDVAAVTTPDGSPPTEGKREFSCRWIVNGFWRNQFYPSKNEHRPKWIAAFIKGPDDKPLRVPTHTVYTVTR